MKKSIVRTALGPLLAGLLVLSGGPAPAGDEIPEAMLRGKDPQRVAEVVEGKRPVASAAWWGFNPEDATQALQEAVSSGARRLIVPEMGRPWVVARSIRLASNQEIVFQRGVVLEAMKGKFLGKGESLVQATDRHDITLSGDGATFLMHKEDYTKPPYEKAEWRHALSLVGCARVKVYGLTLRQSGGDGIYLGATARQNFCKDVHVKDVTCDGNHRQGISVISAENLLIENCRLIGTRGTAPQAGIDLEPNHEAERLVNCTIRGCVVEDNAGPGILAYLGPLSGRSPALSVRFEDCVVRRCGSFGLGVGMVGEKGPKGSVEFRNVRVEATEAAGARVYDKAADGAVVRFVGCTWKETARKRDNPVVIALRSTNRTGRPGGVEFADCTIEDAKDRPAVAAQGKALQAGVFNVHGTIRVKNPHGARADLGPRQENVSLTIAP